MSASNAMNWVASGLETYLAGLHAGDECGTPHKPIDYLIVGSGYGGSLSAADISRRSDASVYLFERGAEFLPGMFPANTAELIGHIRLSKPGSKGATGNPEGLFDVHADGGVSTVCANGLGGGSLINAGVMRRPVSAVFEHERWPRSITLDSLQSYYREAELLLGSRVAKVLHDKDAEVLHDQDAEVLHDRDAEVLLDSKDTESTANVYCTKLAGHKASKAEFLRLHAEDRKDFHYERAELTISLAARPNQAGVYQESCIACGDCATGCNHNAKNSLDTNLLQQARRQGAKIFTGATVLKTERAVDDKGEALWVVHIVYSNRDIRLRDPGYRPTRPGAKDVRPNVNTVYCRNLLLCAGTLGSTEILKRSASSTLKFSPALGDHFSTNGDMLAFCDTENLQETSELRRPHSVANQHIAPQLRKIGPTICAVVSTDDPGADTRGVPDLLIEEMAVPGPLQPFVGVGTSIVRSIRNLAKYDFTVHEYGDDPARESDEGTQYTGVYAIMGDDDAGGSLELESFENQPIADQPSDGYLRVRFARAGRHELFERQMKALRKLLSPQPKTLRARLAKLLSNNHDSSPIFSTPGWRLPGFAGRALGDKNPHEVVTVHPLGGCVMADDVETGVVNEYGEVFNAADRIATSVHQGLYVLDGSIIPTALAANPALTISALALRALRDPESSLKCRINGAPNPAPAADYVEQKRPLFSESSFMGNEPTTLDVIERMKGRAVFIHRPDDSGKTESIEKVVEVTLRMGPIDPGALYIDNEKSNSVIPVNGVIRNNTGVISQIRIFDPDTYEQTINRHNNGLPMRREALKQTQHGETFDEVLQNQTHLDQYLANHAEVTILVSGSLDVFHRETSKPWPRISAMVRNNYGFFKPVKLFANLAIAGARSLVTGQKAGNAIPYLSAAIHAADTRYMTYRLNAEHFFVDDTAKQLPTDLIAALRRGDSQVLCGRKIINDDRNRNLWRQLSQMYITDMPGIVPEQSTRPLSLDLDLLAQLRIPLLRVAKQDQLINTKLALIGLSGYLLRMLLPLQFSNYLSYSSRKPAKQKSLANAQQGRTPQRFPENIAELPAAEIAWQPVVDRIPDDRIEHLPKGTPVRIRLTRYRNTSIKPPVLLLHGYSASGTTFTHKTLKMPFAKMLHNQGYDVWVLDMRTSCAMDSAQYPWSFEDVAKKDIPEAIEHIVTITGFEKINVVAHCMGAAMFSMAVLGPWNTGLHNHIKSAVLSQVPPVIRLREAGRFRAFLSAYLKTFLPQTEYQLQASAEPSATENIADFILSTLPYPDAEQTIEETRAYRNVDYQKTRRRLDLLYTRTFHIENVSPQTLEHIDDLFGPLNLQTISQSIHFARQGWVTDRIGKDLQPDITIAQSLENQWTFPTYAFIGKENSLFEPGALREFEQIFQRQNMKSTLTIADPVDGYGHQDVFMADNAREMVFEDLLSWLDSQQGRTQPQPSFYRPDTQPVCYRIKGIAMRCEDYLTIRINQQDLYNARLYRAPTRLGVWTNAASPMLDTFTLADYQAELNQPNSWLYAIDTTHLSLDKNDDYVIELSRADHPRLFCANGLRFFFESEFPIHRSAEITELPAHDAGTNA